MKNKIILIMSFITIGIFLNTLPAFAENLKDIRSSLEQALSEELENSNKFSIYGYIHEELVNYYGKTDFSDSDRTTGWFRVDDFLKWLKENENILEQKFIENYTIENASSEERKNFLRKLVNIAGNENTYSYPPKNADAKIILAGFLGAYYTASHFTDIESIYPIGIVPNIFSMAYTSFIEIEETPNIVLRLNGGIHEGAHVLPFTVLGIEAETPSDNLSEEIAVVSQMLFGLPQKGEASFDITGVRDLKFDLQNESLGYAESITAFLQLDNFADIFNQGEIKKIYNLKVLKTAFSINDNVLLKDLIDIYKHHLKYNGNILTFKEYTKIINVLPENQERISVWLEDLIDEMNEKKPFPICIRKRDYEDDTDCYENYIDHNKKVFYNLILKRIKDMPFPAYPKELTSNFIK